MQVGGAVAHALHIEALASDSARPTMTTEFSTPDGLSCHERSRGIVWIALNEITTLNMSKACFICIRKPPNGSESERLATSFLANLLQLFLFLLQCASVASPLRIDHWDYTVIVS
ncbi:hypothetical protein ACJRO7_030796 [Eucalyptus globulus]|uniref:Uncharacterized protein n=1 Tax=Eucalyptus globulus TaxID=34317 RepID=A0ABD3JGR3_EUCGL